MNDEEFRERMEQARLKAAARRVWLDALEVRLQAMEVHAVRLQALTEQVRREL